MIYIEKPEIYMHDFADKADIVTSFGIPYNTLDDCHVFLAYYHCGDYGCDSSAFVLYEKEGKLYEVHGSHCSCHGLDEENYWGGTTSQWDSEEVTVEALRHRLAHGCLGMVGGYDDEGYHNESKVVVEWLEKT